MTATKPDHKQPSLGSIASILLLVLGIYVLSIGPMARYGQSRKLPQSVETVYRPLILLDDTPLRPVFEGYLALWGVVIVGHVGP